MILCTTGVASPTDGPLLQRSVQTLGGAIVSNLLTKSTTHLVVFGRHLRLAEASGGGGGEKHVVAVSGKYQMAAQRGRAVVWADWVFASAKEGAWLGVGPFAVGTFSDLVVVDTGLSAEERSRVKALVTQGDGEFFETLVYPDSRPGAVSVVLVAGLQKAYRSTQRWWRWSPRSPG